MAKFAPKADHLARVEYAPAMLEIGNHAALKHQIYGTAGAVRGYANLSGNFLKGVNLL
ncbi:MAG: hypothetical protein LBI31_01570 [Zoogloeaceae bacterium]|nr:hypothetical protein [Zoogloeaceae bacterium]